MSSRTKVIDYPCGCRIVIDTLWYRSEVELCRNHKIEIYSDAATMTRLVKMGEMEK